jgi:farnesyl-diphosphate farnesyltransferase
MFTALDDAHLDGVLKSVSRAFYLSLQVLPTPVREQMGITYLIARAATTIARAGELAPPERESLIDGLMRALGNRSACEAEAHRIQSTMRGVHTAESNSGVIRALDRAVDRLNALDPFDMLIAERVLTVFMGGLLDELATFTPDALRALQTVADLDAHCDAVSGSIGAFWTKLTHHQLPELAHVDKDAQVARAIRFGKALHYTRIIKDAGRQLANGRCYIPLELLRAHGLTPETLIYDRASHAVRRAVTYLCDIARDNYDAGLDYVAAIPANAHRIRLAAVLPLWLGLETLEALRKSDDPLNPYAPVKLSRKKVYRIFAEASSATLSDSLMQRMNERRREAARTSETWTTPS